MNKKGFTLVELLATLVVLSIVVTITVVSVTGGFGDKKDKTEDVFVATINDALKLYLDSSDAKALSFDTQVCTLNKSYGKRNVYKVSKNLTFTNVINSEFKPITQNDLVNPANKEVTCANANNIKISIYRDDDLVYYYKVKKSEFLCLKDETGIISTLPEGCTE